MDIKSITYKLACKVLEKNSLQRFKIYLSAGCFPASYPGYTGGRTYIPVVACTVFIY